MTRFLIAGALLAGLCSGPHPGPAMAQPTELMPSPSLNGPESASAIQVPPQAVGQANTLVPETLRNQPITIEAGTGVLLALPSPASTILSAAPVIARVQPASPTSLFLMGVAPGHTTVIATAESGAPIIQYDVTVQSGRGTTPTPAPSIAAPSRAGVTAFTAAQAESAIHRLMPGGLSVRVAAVGGKLMLTGAVANPQLAEQAESIARGFAGDKGAVIPSLTVLSSIQVNLRVRFAEVNRSIERQLGFNWQAVNGSNAFRFGFLTGTAGSGANQIGTTTGNWDINAAIDALAAESLVTILAEPNLTAQSGEPARFLAGGEFPIPIAGNMPNNVAAITVSFKQYGVSLEVVPTVLSPDRLSLRVRPEVSQLTNSGAVNVPIGNGTLSIPALTVRRSETSIELGSGQSFAIAGLLEKTSADPARVFPGAGEIPVIGALFKSNDFQRGESELVIIVTPYLVTPISSPAPLRPPTDGLRTAVDLDHILLGRPLRQPDGAPLNAGFIVK